MNLVFFVNRFMSAPSFRRLFTALMLAGVLTACGGGVDLPELPASLQPPVFTDTTPPVVSMISPLNGATVSNNVNLSVNASDNVGVDIVEYLLDDTIVLGRVSSAPFTFVWDTHTTTNGNHTLTAVAADAAGNLTASTSVNITVSNSTQPPTGDTQKPSVAITAPLNGSVLSGTVTVNASASDNVGVTLVQFVLDGATLLKEVTNSPYTFTWNTTQTANGMHTLTAFARDAAGNLSSSSPINVTVINNNAVLSWDPNTEADLAGYRVYYGTSTGAYIQSKGNGIVVTETSYTVTGLGSGTRYYFTVTAYDFSGNESDYAIEVFKDIP